MSLTRTIVAASLTAAFALPPAALAAAMPQLNPAPKAAPAVPPPIPGAITTADQGGWYIAVDGQPVGPLTDAAVIARLDSGAISGDTLVWRAGMTEWQPAATSMPLVAKRVEAALKNPKGPARKGGLFMDAAWRQGL